jgi:hypothetical protein
MRQGSAEAALPQIGVSDRARATCCRYPTPQRYRLISDGLHSGSAGQRCHSTCLTGRLQSRIRGEGTVAVGNPAPPDCLQSPPSSCDRPSDARFVTVLERQRRLSVVPRRLTVVLRPPSTTAPQPSNRSDSCGLVVDGGRLKMRCDGVAPLSRRARWTYYQFLVKSRSVDRRAVRCG